MATASGSELRGQPVGPMLSVSRCLKFPARCWQPFEWTRGTASSLGGAEITEHVESQEFSAGSLFSARM